MKQLIVLPFMPAPNATQAGHRLAFDFIKNLSSKNEVYLFLIVRSHEKVIPAALEELCSKRNIKIYEIGNISVLLNWFFFGFLDYFRFMTRYKKYISSELISYCQEQKFDVVRFEFSQTFRYARDLINSGYKTIIQLSVHDLQVQVILRKNNLESLMFRWAYRTEKRMLEVADEIFSLSEKDKTFIQYLLDIGRPVTVVQPSLSSFVYEVKRKPEGIRKNTLLFWGAMNRIENEAAVIFFAEKILKKLRAAGYMYELFIVGSNPGPKVKELACDYIEVTGFLENPASYFEKASIGIVPLVMGAGVKLKTLELLQAGLQVISSPVGAEGVSENKEKMIVTDIANFEEELVKLYED